MSVSTFNVFEKKLTGGPKILFNLENKFHKFYTSMINGASRGGEGGLDIII